MNFLDALSFGPKITYPPEKPAGEPPMEGGTQEQWAAYRRQQAMVHNTSGLTPQAMEANALLDVMAKSIGGGRGTVNPDSVDPSVPPIMEEQGGSGRGSVNPSSVTPTPSAEDGILATAFPEVFRKQPPTGVANTNGGVERVNARTSEHGVTAIQKDGKTYMTNLNADGSVNKGTGSPNSVLGNGLGGSTPSASMSTPNVSGTISSTLDQLKKTEDYAQARGLMGNLVQTIAEQKSRMEQGAIESASVKFNIPQLETMLQQAVQADMASVGWYPGIGDSPSTAKLRTEIGQAHINARQYAGTYLSSNTSYSALTAHEKVAQLEFDRIKTSVTRKETLDDRSAERQQYALEQRKMMAADEVARLNPTQIKRMAILSPALGVVDANGKLDPIPVARAMKDESLMAAVTADPTTLAVLALERNPHARILISRLESGGLSEQEVDGKLEQIAKTANDPKFVQKYADYKFAGKKKEKEAYVTAKTQSKLSTDKAGKEEARRQNLLDALEMERAMQTTYAVQNISTLLPTNGIYKGIMELAMKEHGNLSLDSVATQLMRTAKNKEDATAKKIMLAQDIQNALKDRKASIFGAPDANKLQQALIESTRTVWEGIQAPFMERSNQIKDTFSSVYGE